MDETYRKHKTVGIELQPCCGERSGVGTYEYEIVKRFQSNNEIQYVGNLFDFLGRRSSCEEFKTWGLVLQENRVLPYRGYRLLNLFFPLPYGWIFKPTDVTLFFNYIVPRNIKGRVVTTIYDMTYMRFPETMHKRNLIRLKNGIERSVNRSDIILTISEFSKWEIMHFLNVPEEKIKVLYCATPDKEIPINFAAVAEKYKINKPYILYVGTIEPRKNLVNLIRSFDQLKSQYGLPHQLVLAGGNGWQNEEIFRTAKEIQHSKDIVFTGFVSDAEKSTLYQNASVFAFPSLYEGFGIPPLEAMSWGVPVLTSNAASLPEVVGDAAVIIDPYDIEGISDGLYRLLTDNDLREDLINKGYKQIEKFTWEESANKLQTICEEILEG